jgi:hypothetical protein
MSLKTVSDSSTGDSTHVGGADWNKVARLLAGTSNVLSVDINSLFSFRDSKLRLTNGANICTIRNLNIDRSLAYYLPKPFSNNDDTLVCANTDQTLTNKTIDASSNTISGIVALPSARKWGAIMMGSGDLTGNSGIGLLQGFSNLPANPVFQVGATNGINWRYNSGGSANTLTGIGMSTATGAAFATRAFHSAMRAKTRVLTGPATTRQYVGFSTRPRLPGSDTPIATDESAVLVGWRTSDTGTAIQVFRNSGFGGSSTPSVVSTGVAPTTGVTQYEVSFPNDTEARVRILSSGGGTVLYDSQTTGNFTTNIPAAATTTMMMPTAVYSTTGTNTNYDMYFMQCEQDQ